MRFEGGLLREALTTRLTRKRLFVQMRMLVVVEVRERRVRLRAPVALKRSNVRVCRNVVRFQGLRLSKALIALITFVRLEPLVDAHVHC